MEEGFLREAILNYMALLGWAYDEKTTIFSTDELIEKFDTGSINKKPAKFDYEKLLWINGYYIRNLSDGNLAELLKNKIKDYLESEKTDNLEKSAGELEQKIIKITPLVKERIKTLKESVDMISPFFVKISYSDKSQTYFKNKDIDAPGILESAFKALSELDKSFHAGDIEKSLRSVSDKFNINFRKIAEVIRIAIWDSIVSPPLFETIGILGKELALKRIEEYLRVIS